MIQAIVAVVLAAAALAREVTVEQAGKSPYDFARYVESQTDIDWATLWRAVGNADDPPEFLPRSCSTELITVLKPSQVIAILQGAVGAKDHYFRFMEGGGAWRFAGHYAVSVLPRRHEIFRFRGKPFLKIAEDGVRAIDYNLELEHWFDLTQLDFSPVFTFPVSGGQERHISGISRQLNGNAVESATDTADAINVAVFIRFSYLGNDLGQKIFLATYERPPGQATFTLRNARASPGAVIPNQEFEDLANVLSAVSNEQMLVYALPGLKKLVSGKDAEAKMWLKEMLDKCKDTPEKRTLLELLAKP